ncbi:MAG: hypothetical protein V4857_30700 [Pseudomonadota bacterium]
MFKLLKCLAMLAMCVPNFCRADLISPQVQAAQERLRANPNTFDRFDTYCAGKRPGALCTIAGNTFAGGGKGVCTNAINESKSSIDLSCVRSERVEIDRKLPAGGFVHDADLCARQATIIATEDGQENRRWNCTPEHPAPADRFCRGKAVGSACTAELSREGSMEKHAGVCTAATETENFYYQGRRLAKREVIKCEPGQPAKHIYAPASWRQKLFR